MQLSSGLATADSEILNFLNDVKFLAGISGGGMMLSILACLEKWQTMAAGILALVGALATIGLLIRHHSYEKKKHQEEQQKMGLFSRSLIPDALNILTKYSDDCFLHVWDEDELPALPQGAVDILKENIKYSDFETSKKLFEIVSFYQVHNARLSSYSTSRARNRKERMVYDISLLRHYWNELFSYGRNEIVSVGNINPDRDKILQALKNVMGNNRWCQDKEAFDEASTMVENVWRQEGNG